jgi:AraC-like DNA-binding protein
MFRPCWRSFAQACDSRTGVIDEIFRRRLVNVRQSFVGACQPGGRPSFTVPLERQKGDVVRDPDAKRLGALPSAAGGISRLAYAQAKEAGIDLNILLKKAGLTVHQLEDPGVRLKVRDQISFLNLAADALQDDLLGFHLAQPPDLREMGLLYYVSVSSDILSEALHRAARYSRIANEGVSLKYIEGRDACITFDYVGVSRYLDRHQIEFFVTTLVRMCRQLTGLRLEPTRVRLAHRRENCSELFEFLGSDIEFGAGIDEIAFSTSVKRMPVVSADPHLNKLLLMYCEEAVSHRAAIRSSFQSSVENALVPLLPHGKAKVGEIARRLGVSQRTFARRLSSEGLTFSGVLENLRSNLAERYLTDAELSISQIAWLLGYQEVSAFTHAFKRWTGTTPREARSLVAS